MVEPLNRPSGPGGTAVATSAGIVPLGARLAADARQSARRRPSGPDALGEPLPAIVPLAGWRPDRTAQPVAPTAGVTALPGGHRRAAPPPADGGELADDRPERSPAASVVAEAAPLSPPSFSVRCDGELPAAAQPDSRPGANAALPAPSLPAMVYRFASWGAAHAVRIECHTGNDGRAVLRLMPSDAAVRRILGRHLAEAPPGTLLGGTDDGHATDDEEDRR